jgi:type VI secretion system protein ImpM
MRFGLFGKLQSKRDFIAVATPRQFLAVWEPWVQGGISASRAALGNSWQSIYLTAPIWRFWLGAEVCGTTTVGALMPSVDGVGRYYPLTIAGFAEAHESPSPPELDPYDGWFATIEDFLLSTLEAGRAFEAVTGALEQLQAPAFAHGEQGDVVPLSPYAGVATVAGEDFAEAFARTRRADPASAYANMSFWWTAGGQDFERRAFATPRMPDPHLFSAMLTGDFTNVGNGEHSAP